MRGRTQRARTAWPVGGDIVVSGRRLGVDDARRLAGFYADALGEARQSPDPKAAAYLSRQLEQVASAMTAAERWRRAATGPAFRDW